MTQYTDLYEIQIYAAGYIIIHNWRVETARRGGGGRKRSQREKVKAIAELSVLLTKCCIITFISLTISVSHNNRLWQYFDLLLRYSFLFSAIH